MAFSHATTDQLEALSYDRLDDITGLDIVRSNAQWERIVDAVRDQVLFADLHSRDADTLIHELADYLVPSGAAIRASDLACIGAAWRADLTYFRPYASAYGQWRNADLPNLDVSTVSAEAGRALYVAYTAAVRKLVAFAFELQAKLEGEAVQE